MRKYFISILAAIMLLLSTSVVSFAGNAENRDISSEIPEAVALVVVDNPDCKLINEIKDLCVKISMKDSGKIIAEIPVVRVEEADDDMLALWLGYEPKAKITASIKEEMREFQKDFHLGNWEDLKKMFESMNDDELEAYIEKMTADIQRIFSNYTVELTGLPNKKDHQFEMETGAMILTSELTSELMSLTKNIIGEAFGMTKSELAEITDFSSMLEMIETKLVEKKILKKGEDIFSLIENMTEMKFTEAEKTAFYDELKQLDDILAYMKSEDYEGTVIAGVNVTCGCPVKTDYEIVHQYFKEVNGKMTLAGTEYYGPMDGIYEGFTGDVIKASDYIKCDYKGETYKYIGSYDSAIQMEQQSDVDRYYNSESWWKDAEMDKFELTNEDDEEFWDAPYGLLLRYELRETKAAAVNKGDSPKTSDDFNMMPYVAAMILSAAAVLITVVSRKRG